MRERRLESKQASARRTRFVLKGDTLSAGTFWHGKLMSEWAKGNYVTCASGECWCCGPLVILTKAAGQTAAESLRETKIGK